MCANKGCKCGGNCGCKQRESSFSEKEQDKQPSKWIPFFIFLALVAVLALTYFSSRGYDPKNEMQT